MVVFPLLCSAVMVKEYWIAVFLRNVHYNTGYFYLLWSVSTEYTGVLQHYCNAYALFLGSSFIYLF